VIELIPTESMEMVRNIAAHPDIWSRFSDGVEIEDYHPCNDDCNQWLIIYVDSDIAGIIRVFCESTCAIEYHPYMTKPYRKYFRDTTALFYKWFLENTPDSTVKINVMFPECFKSTLNASKKVGFIQEGVNRDSYRLDGKVYNQIMSGITRKEVEHELAKS
jgi:hypothetical protein